MEGGSSSSSLACELNLAAEVMLVAVGWTLCLTKEHGNRGVAFSHFFSFPPRCVYMEKRNHLSSIWILGHTPWRDPYNRPDFSVPLHTGSPFLISPALCPDSSSSSLDLTNSSRFSLVSSALCPSSSCFISPCHILKAFSCDFLSQSQVLPHCLTDGIIWNKSRKILQTVRLHLFSAGLHCLWLDILEGFLHHRGTLSFSFIASHPWLGLGPRLGGVWLSRLLKMALSILMIPCSIGWTNGVVRDGPSGEE